MFYYLWLDLWKPDTIAHSLNSSLLNIYNLLSLVNPLAKFQSHMPIAFQVTALQSYNNRKIDLCRKYWIDLWHKQINMNSCMQMWPDLRKPKIISQALIYSIKYWIQLVNTCIKWKNSINFVNAFFVVKEGPNIKKLDIILFACSRGVWKSLFSVGRTMDTEGMGICLHHVKMIVRNRSFFTNIAMKRRE